jgi:hypothetical protein
MMYMIKRGDQEFGPYSGNDIQQYLASGNIVESDMVRAEGSDRWLSVKDILAKKGQAGASAPQSPDSQAAAPQFSAPEPSFDAAPAPQPMGDPMFDPAPAPSQGNPADSWGAPAPQYGSAPAPMGGDFGMAGAGAAAAGGAGGPSGAMANGAPLPPGMNWILVIALAFLTCGIFAFVYLFIQAGWVHRLDPQKSKAKKFLVFMLAAYGFVLLSVLLGIVVSVAMPDSFLGPMISVISPIGNIAFLVFYILGVFNMRSTLEGYFNAVEPINLKLNPILTFFFAVYYFQYHFNRITTWKTTGNLPR